MTVATQVKCGYYRRCFGVYRLGAVLLRSMGLMLLLNSVCWAQALPEVRAVGLFKGQALLEINGKRKLVKVGQRVEPGILLVSAGTKAAVIQVNGEQRRLNLSRQRSGSYKAPQKQEVRIATGRGGHFLAQGSINSRPVEMMVDTGATSVAMSLPTARKLGVDYRSGSKVQVSTANGLAPAYRVMLRSVSVGGLEIKNVEAFVNMSDFPRVILLGNSYLSRVDLERQDGVLLLKSRY